MSGRFVFSADFPQLVLGIIRGQQCFSDQEGIHRSVLQFENISSIVDATFADEQVVGFWWYLGRQAQCDIQTCGEVTQVATVDAARRLPSGDQAVVRPLWYFPRDFGNDGLWMAMCAFMLARGLVLHIWYLHWRANNTLFAEPGRKIV